jgi:hypothetical protein
MKLPQADRAIVPEAKITRYLLSRTNPRGQQKVRFFERFGFSIGRWEALADALLAHGRAHDVVAHEVTSFGTWYTVEGNLETPVGETPKIRSVWFVDSGASIPRFVTAYPLPRRRS